MAGTAEDDGYSDDDLDALGSEDFLELQEQALQATQQRSAPNQLQHLLLRGKPISQLEVDQVVKHGTSTPSTLLPAGGHPAAELPRGLFNGHPPHPPGGRYGQQYGPSEASQREQWRLRRFGSTTAQGSGSRGSNFNETTRLNLPHRAASQEDRTEQVHQSKRDGSEAALRAPGALESGEDLEGAMKQLLFEKESWLAERSKLEQAVQAANEQLMGKQGEIAVLRSNHSKQVQERERSLDEIRQQQRAQDERHRADLEQLRKEKEKLITQNRFLDHENSERTWLTRTAARNGTRNLGLTDGASTPKRPKRSDVGDGFEDNELEAASPSKPTSRPKSGTPKAGAKRKRDIFNISPGAVADLPQDSNDLAMGSKPSPVTPFRQGTLEPPGLSPIPSEFLHRLLYHKDKADDIRIFESMAGFAFPSEKSASLAQLFMDKAPPYDTADLEDPPATYGIVLLGLWSRCLMERYYSPIKSLIDMLKFVLLNGTFTTAISLMDEVVNLSQRTADINIIPRFKKLNKNAKVISVHLHDQALESSNEINTQDCLQLLYLTAHKCVRDSDAMTRFWHCMRFDFISMVLRVVQTIDDIILMVRLLQTCVDHDIFAAIKPQSTEGGSAEQHVMDRISSMLIEVPRPIDGNEPYDLTDILKLRHTILGLIEGITEQQLCSKAFVTHPLALGRLVRIMNDELNAIYTSQYCRSSRSEIVNRSIRLLFYLTITFPQEIDLQGKLRRQPGGVNKFLITLSRLAFSDGIWYECGISEDAFDCAHQLLEDFVTPEEAEALKKAFVKNDA